MKPLVLKFGSIRIRILRFTQKSGYSFYRCYGRCNGKAVTVGRSDLEEAKLAATDLAKQIARGEGPRPLPSREEREQVEVALQFADKIGTPLEVILGEYGDCKRKLNGIPLMQAVGFYLSRHPTQLNEMKPGAVLADLLRVADQDGIGARHMKDLECRLKLFAADFDCYCHSITGDLIDRWLRAMQERNKWSGLSRNHYRAAVSRLMHRAVELKAAPRDWFMHEWPAVKTAAVERGEIQIYTRGELDQMLSQSRNPALTAFLALQAWTGARTSEIQRHGLAALNLERMEYHVSRGKVRTAGDRIIAIAGCARVWLEKAAGAEMPACDTTLTDWFTANCKAAGVRRINNGLRHSFASYWMAVHGDGARLSAMMGTELGTLHKHYRKGVSKTEGERWFL